MILLFLWIMYLLLQYCIFLERVSSNIALSFRECISASKSPTLKLVLYLSNFNTYYYVYITEIFNYPESVVTHVEGPNLYLIFHQIIVILT